MINNINSTNFIPSVFNKGNNSSAIIPQGGKILPNQGSQESLNISNEGKLTSIMSKYNVRNMSFNEQKQMADELINSGLINEVAYAHMTKPPIDFSQITGQLKPDFNSKRDIIGDYENNLAFMKQTRQDKNSIEFMEHMLKVYKELETYNFTA